MEDVFGAQARQRGPKSRELRELRKLEVRDRCCGPLSDDEDAEERRRARKAKQEAAGPWYKTMRLKHVLILLLVVGGALQTIVPAIAQIADLFVSHYEELDASSPDDLHRVFKSGEAWSVLCHNGTGPVSAVFQEAASQSRGMTPRYAQPRWATLNCDTPLPSGKSTLERFKFFRGAGSRVAFTVANGKRPEQVPSTLLQRAVTPGRGASVPIENAGAALLKHVNGKTKLPKLRTAGSTSQLRQHCFDKRSCGLLLYPGKPDATARLQLQQLVAQHRLTRFAIVDAKKYMLHPLEAKLPPVLGGVKSYPRFVYFKREEAEAAAPDAAEGEGEGEGEKKGRKKGKKKGKKGKKNEKQVSWRAKAFRGHFSAPEVSAFLGELEAAERAGDAVRMASLRKVPKLRTRPKKAKKDGKAKGKKAAPKKGKKGKGKKRKPEAQKPNIRVKDDVKPKAAAGGDAAAAEQRRAQAEKERVRREEMEREAREKYPHLADDDETEAWFDDEVDVEDDAGDAEDEDDEEELDLDELEDWPEGDDE